nr:hypothetical protein [Tanacetum cinerariifolium]
MSVVLERNPWNNVLLVRDIIRLLSCKDVYLLLHLVLNSTAFELKVWKDKDVKEKNGKKIVVEIYSGTDEESTPVVKKEKIKKVLIEKVLKKKGKLIVEDSKITKNDSRKKVKIVFTKDQDEKLIDEEEREDLNSKKFQVLKNSLIQNFTKDSSLLEPQSDENDTKSVDMQFDEITVQDEVDKKTREKEIEYLILRFKKDHTNNKRKKLDGGSAKDYKDVDTHGGNNGSKVYYEKDTDIWVDNGKSLIPFDDLYFLNSDSSLLPT